VRVLTTWIPADDRGVRVTVAALAAVARAALRSDLLRRTARAIVDPTAEGWPVRYGPTRLRCWLDAVWSYEPDPDPGVELVRDPVTLLVAALESGAARGDCDDAAGLAVALGMACGYSCRLTLYGFNGWPFSHVFAELAGPDGAWLEMDVTRPSATPPGLRVTATEGWPV
jgi:hypothetical protein